MSNKISLKLILLAAISILFGSLAQLFLKVAALQTLNSLSFFVKLQLLLSNKWFLSGLILYILCLFAWLFVLKTLPLSVAYPLLSLNYILVYVGATQWPMLSERIEFIHIVGNLLIMSGVLLVLFPRKQRYDS